SPTQRCIHISPGPLSVRIIRSRRFHSAGGPSPYNGWTAVGGMAARQRATTGGASGTGKLRCTVLLGPVLAPVPRVRAAPGTGQLVDLPEIQHVVAHRHQTTILSPPFVAQHTDSRRVAREGRQHDPAVRNQIARRCPSPPTQTRVKMP